MIACLFPGHGSETARMGLALARADARAAALLEHAGALAEVDATKVLRRGGDRLSDTRVLQPLLTAVSLGIAEALARAGVRPQLALGHSLGELAAWSALGGVGSEEAIAIAATRGRLLAEASVGFDGAMLALPRLEDAERDAALALGRERGLVELAIHSAPGRFVVSGERAALAAIAARVGGSFVATSGAWHCSVQRGAREPFRAALEALPAVAPTPGLITNCDGQRLGDRGRAFLVDALVSQIDGRVEFARGVATLIEADPDELILIGPPRVLRALLRDNLHDRLGTRDLGALARPRIHVAEGPEDIDALARLLGGSP